MSSLEVGARVGHYEILGLLGAGGMGQVYRALDRSLERHVAIKVLPEELTDDDERLLRFGREAKVLASLNHPHVVTIHAVESQGPLRFFVMELIEGRTLAQMLDETKAGLEDFLDHALPIVDAVAAAHERGITHRDLKPGNVMVTASGWVKVLDFGLAKESALESSSSTQAPTAGMTQQGTILGTVPYMSPEQLQGKAVGPVSDVFSLGTLLYEMATGDRPFRGDSQAELISSILRDNPEPAGCLASGLPNGVDAILERCLEKSPARRFQTARELFVALRALSGSSSASRPAAAMLQNTGSAKSHYRTPMVGRETEAEKLRQAIAEAATGRGSLVTLAGEPGVGKTRLASAALDLARERGFWTVVGNCYEGEGVRPFAPWVEILDSTSRIAEPEALRDLLGDGAPEIAKLQPALKRLYPDLPPPLKLPPEAERAYLFDCFRGFVERSSQRQPLLLVLEDLHWADEPTLLLLQHLALRLGEMPLVVIGTYRDVELDVARPLANALRELVRERLVRRITLGRLDEAGVTEILAALGGEAPPSSLVAAIHGETEGNPFFVEEVYEHLAEEGRLFDDDGRWRKDLTIEELDVPEGVRLVVGRRLERLDESAQQVLNVAAVHGRRFFYSLVEATEGVDAALLLDAVETAERLHLIEPMRSSSEREVRYQFSHELIRHTLLQGLSMPRRQRLHLQVAEAMERFHGDGIEEHAAAMAHHLYEAGAAADVATTFRFLSLAARQAFDTGGFEQVIEATDLALSIAPTAEPLPRSDLLFRRGLARRSLGFPEKAADDFRQALDLCEEVGDRQRVATTSATLAHLLGWQARSREALETVEHGLALVEGEEDPAHCRLLAMHAMILGTTARGLDESDAALDRARALAESLGDAQLQTTVAWTASYTSWFSMRGEVLRASSEAALQGFEAIGDLWNRIDTQVYVGWGRLHAGRTDGEEIFDDEMAERLGQYQALFFVLQMRALSVLARTGSLDRFEELLERALEIAQRAGMPWWTLVQSWLNMATFWRGDWERARELQAEVAPQATGTGTDGVESSALLYFDCHLGNRDPVLGVLDAPAPADLLPRKEGPSPAGAWTMLLRAVEGLMVLGERERAAAISSLLDGALATGTVFAPHATRLVQTVAGIGATARGDWQRADEHFETALRQAQEMPFVCEQADARRWYARMLLDRGAPDDRDRAQRFLEEASTIYRQIGMPRHIEMVEGLLLE